MFELASKTYARNLETAVQHFEETLLVGVVFPNKDEKSTLMLKSVLAREISEVNIRELALFIAGLWHEPPEQIMKCSSSVIYFERDCSTHSFSNGLLVAIPEMQIFFPCIQMIHIGKKKMFKVDFKHLLLEIILQIFFN